MPRQTWVAMRPSVLRRFGLLTDRDRGGMGLLVGHLGPGTAQVGQERLGPLLVLRPLAQHVSVGGRLDRAGTDRRVDLGEHEEIEIVLFGTRSELLSHEGAQVVHAGLALLQAASRFLPRTAHRVWLAQRQQSAPHVEDVLNLLLRPVLLARHQLDVKRVAVLAHVQDVEQAHRLPAVLVGHRERHQAVLLHLRREGLQLVKGLRDRVAVFGEDALAVLHHPRVIGDLTRTTTTPPAGTAAAPGEADRTRRQGAEQQRGAPDAAHRRGRQRGEVLRLRLWACHGDLLPPLE